MKRQLPVKHGHVKLVALGQTKYQRVPTVLRLGMEETISPSSSYGKKQPGKTRTELISGNNESEIREGESRAKRRQGNSQSLNTICFRRRGSCEEKSNRWTSDIVHPLLVFITLGLDTSWVP